MTSTVIDSLFSRDPYFPTLTERVLSLLAVYELGPCEYETPESSWGKCDGGHRCFGKGVIHHIASETNVCPKHFRALESL
jgi:hypothetical protein